MDAIGRLAGGIAHDFNNLMTIVTGYSEMLSTALDRNSPLQEKVQEIHKAGEQAKSLTKQLLAFARRQVIQPTLLDLNDVLAEMGTMLRRLVNENIEFSILNQSGSALVRADRSQLEQVILNLVINASDAMPEGGRLVLAMSGIDTDIEKEAPGFQPNAPPGSFVRLTVSDTGHGMDADTRMRIFEPFFTTKEPGKGTGLGLATVYGIVEQAGGHITVSSEPGSGATFDVYLQRAEGEISQTAKREPAQVTAGNETILVVEDQNGLRRMLLEILQQNGYRVITAADGRQALRLMEGEPGPVQLAITDLVMPQMGGRDLGRALSLSHPETKVLYSTGYVSNLAELLTDRRAFIEKPFTPEALLRKVREVLDGPSN
jgi:CheY-like chemotaxis protein